MPANKPTATTTGVSASTPAPALMTPPAQLAESGEKLSAAEWKKVRKQRNKEQKRLDEAASASASAAALAARPSPSPSSPASPSHPAKTERGDKAASDSRQPERHSQEAGS
ncbi:MAG: hypothetical protein M1826_006305 [Phylliscum demangeonii]|nr:MAG: hypothetical protein M1826_006305 [Phylliscum demangeonii]